MTDEVQLQIQQNVQCYNTTSYYAISCMQCPWRITHPACIQFLPNISFLWDLDQHERSVNRDFKKLPAATQCKLTECEKKLYKQWTVGTPQLQRASYCTGSGKHLNNSTFNFLIKCCHSTLALDEGYWHIFAYSVTDPIATIHSNPCKHTCYAVSYSHKHAT